jgi:hypothetical protein
MARLARCAVGADAAASVAWLAALTPDGDTVQALPLIERALKKKPGLVNNLNTHALVLYRLGRYPEAADKARATMKAAGGEGAIWDWLILAMACQRQGQADEAGRWLERVEAWFAQPPEKRVGYDRRPLSWDSRLDADVLRREAEGLLRSR